MSHASRDPSGYLTTPPSVVVKVVQTARADINGLTGIVISYNLDRERYLVHMTKTQSTMALKKENLVKANMMESYRAQWQQLRNDPRVREKMTHYVHLCQQYVLPFQLSHVVVGLSTIWICMIYMFGFPKTLMTTSVIILILVIAGPDLVNRSSPQMLLQHFPDRARQVIEQQLPMLKGRLTNRMAVGVVVFLVVVCLQSLFFTSNHPMFSSSATSSGQGGIGTHTIMVPPEEMMEKYYSMGFHDAQKGHEHGFSLKEEAAARELQATEDGNPIPSLFDLDGTSTAAGEGGKEEKSTLVKLANLSNVMSLFYLYHTMVDLGTDHSTNLFSVGQLAANFQHHTEWWKKLLLGLSVYNVLRIFL